MAKNDDLDPQQERLLREMISKEMIKKIQHRIENEDKSVMKTFRNVIDEEAVKSGKVEKALKKIMNDKQDAQ